MNKNIEKFECKRCDHEWIPRVVLPVRCPRCKSPYWNKEKRK